MAIHQVQFSTLDEVMQALRKTAIVYPALSTYMNDLVIEIQRAKDDAERITNVAIRFARMAKYSGSAMVPADTLLITGIAPCVFCQYNGEGFYQPQTHGTSCPWENVGGLTERGALLMIVYGDPAWITRS